MNLCVAIPTIIQIHGCASALFRRLNLSKPKWTVFKNITGNNLSPVPQGNFK